MEVEGSKYALSKIVLILEVQLEDMCRKRKRRR